MRIIAEIPGTVIKRSFEEVLVKFPTAKMQVNFPTKLFQCKPTLGAAVLYQIVADEKEDVFERVVSNENVKPVMTEKKVQIINLLDQLGAKSGTKES